MIDFVKNYTKKLLKGVRRISDGHKENYANEWGFPDSSVGKESASVWETPVGFLSQEDPLEKG